MNKECSNLLYHGLFLIANHIISLVHLGDNYLKYPLLKIHMGITDIKPRKKTREFTSTIFRLNSKKKNRRDLKFLPNTLSSNQTT